LAHSYVNLANPGTNDATPGVAPAWAADTGWQFTGTQYLGTGLTPPNTQTWSLVVRFSDISGTDGCVVGCRVGVKYFMVQPNRSDGKVGYWHGTYRLVAPAATSGVFAVAGTQGYRNGAADGGAIGADSSALAEVTIGASGSGLLLSITGNVQAVAIYSDTLTAAEVAMVTAAMDDASNPGTTGLVSWWPMNETSGTRYDVHGSNHLGDNNTVGYTAGVHGYAADFVSANSETLTHTTLGLGGGDWTLVGWFRLDTTGQWCRLANEWGSLSSEMGYSLDVSSGNQLRGRVSGGDVYWTAATLSSGVWYFCAARYDSGSGEVGVSLNGGAWAEAVKTSAAYGFTFSVARETSDYEDISACLVGAFNTPLTSAHLAWLYNGGAGRTYNEVAGAEGGTGFPAGIGSPMIGRA